MNLTDLSAFVRVAELGSLTSAARELGVPKSTISRRIARLEDELGLALIVRNSRRARLTEPGQRLHARAAPSLRELRDAERELLDARREPAGILRLTAPHDMGALPWFARLLAGYRTRYPDVSLDVELTNRVVDLVGEGFDVALRPRREGPADASSLMARKLAGFVGALYATRQYVAEHGAPRAPAALARHACITHSVVTPGGTWTLHHEDGREASVTVAPALTTNDFGLATNAVLEGLGIGLVPSFGALTSEARAPLVRILPRWTTGRAGIWLVWPASRHLAPRVRAFVDHTVANAATLGLGGDAT